MPNRGANMIKKIEQSVPGSETSNLDDSKEPVWKTLIHDMLKDNNKYSIGRVLLLISFAVCCIFWVVLRTDAPSTVVASLTLFAGYIFGGKGIEAVKSMKGGNSLEGL